MTATACRYGVVMAAISANIFLISCAGDSGPQPGSPAFDWAAAKQTFAAGDYTKTIDNLDRLSTGTSEYTTKARAWLLVMESGMARANMELADRFEAGARANKGDPTSFRRNMTTFRGQASSQALHFAQVFADFQKTKDETVPLAFAFPTGSANPPFMMTRVATGIIPTTGDVSLAQKQNVERCVLLAACAAAGAPDDPAKTQELLKAVEPKVSRAVFVTAMASALFDASQLYTRQKLDDPEKMKILCTRAQEALKTVPESKITKDLSAKIEKTLKASKT
jgi:hypothetical protein